MERHALKFVGLAYGTTVALLVAATPPRAWADAPQPQSRANAIPAPLVQLGSEATEIFIKGQYATFQERLDPSAWGNSAGTFEYVRHGAIRYLANMSNAQRDLITIDDGNVRAIFDTPMNGGTSPTSLSSKTMVILQDSSDEPIVPVEVVMRLPYRIGTISVADYVCANPVELATSADASRRIDCGAITLMLDTDNRVVGYESSRESFLAHGFTKLGFSKFGRTWVPTGGSGYIHKGSKSGRLLFTFVVDRLTLTADEIPPVPLEMVGSLSRVRSLGGTVIDKRQNKSPNSDEPASKVDGGVQ